MSDTVGFAWWMPATGGSQQAFVRNYVGLERAGHEVRAYTAESMPSMLQNAADLDWALVPFVFSPDWIERLSERTHVHLQVGGYGRNDFDAAREAIAAADSVSVIDPQLAADFPVDDAPWIPNPPNVECFSPTDSEEGYILLAKQAPGGGLGAYRSVVESHPDEEFVVLGDSFPNPPANVRIRPKVPWSWMQQIYADARAVVTLSEQEGLPNVAYEAFLTATPFVALHERGIGDTQQAPQPLIEEIGQPVYDVSTDSSSWDHWAASLESATPEVGQRGREWVDAWAETGWDWASKMDAIRACVR